MSRYDINYKNKWACFSSIADGFITEFMKPAQYKEWIKQEYGKNYKRPLNQFNTKTIQDCASSIRMNRTHNEAIECFLESGLSKEECEQIMYDIETKNYCPIPVGNNKYKCPNCGNEVIKGQKICSNDTCELEFVWR